MEEKSLTLRDSMELGDVFYKSGLFSDLKSAAQAIVKIQAGAELGIPPFAAMSGINVIQGKPALGAGLIAGRIKASGRYDYKIIRLDDTGCVIAFYQGKDKIGESSFTREDATKAGLMSRDMWSKYPRNMFWARAISNGARWYCPDIFSGSVYTPEELGGEVVDADYVVTEAAAPQPEPSKPQPQPHWIEDEATRKRFWAWAFSLGLTDKDVHEALGVEHMRDFAGDKVAAMDAIKAYIDDKAQPDDHADAWEAAPLDVYTPEDVCSIHGVQMTKREKDGQTWYSHRLDDGSWCNGK